MPGSSRFLIGAASFVVVIAGMRAAESLLVPFLIAIFIAVICLPPLTWLQRKKVPLPLAMLIVISGIVVFGTLITALIGTSVDDFARDVPVYQQSLKGKAKEFIQWFKSTGINIPEQKILEAFNPGAAMNVAAGLLTRVTNVFTNAFLILLTVIFILLEGAAISNKMNLLSSRSHQTSGHFDRFIKDINRYMAIKSATSLATGLCITLWLLILGLNYPLLWGMLAFLLNFVPNIGSIIAAVPAVLLGLIQLGLIKTLLVLAGYVVINIVIGSVVEPRIMGKGLGLSTLVVFLSLVFWGWVLGPVGMLLSVPLTMTVKIALDSSSEQHWLSILLSSERSLAETAPAAEPRHSETVPDSD